MEKREFLKSLNEAAKKDGFKGYLHVSDYAGEVVWTTSPREWENNHELYKTYPLPLPFGVEGHYNEFSHVEWESYSKIYEGYCGGDREINAAIKSAYESGTAPKEQTPEATWEWLKGFIFH